MCNARDLRLQSDFDNLRRLAANSGGTLAIEQTKGSPPDQYTLLYRCRTIERLDGSTPVYRSVNRVEIKLPARYPAPFDAPKVRMLTPVWHPHVYKNLVVCMGDWTTSEYLDAFVLRLGALLQFEREFFDIRDPANEEAIDWARRNLLLFPTDTCTFHGDRPIQISPQSAMHTTMGTLPAIEEPAIEDHPGPSNVGSDFVLWEDLN